jgi:hypothetical protein
MTMETAIMVLYGILLVLSLHGLTSLLFRRPRHG